MRITNTITFSEAFKFSQGDLKMQGIEIPMVQRDYAQGRTSKGVERIRNNFLNAIKSSLIEEKDPIKLDFIYGNVVEERLIPLDGQQRLTTLFLLHWYAAKREEIDYSQYSFLSDFRYRTRFSSANFCESLVECNPPFSGESLSK